MDCKISITTRCNSRCKTCPVWKKEGHDMRLDVFKTIWEKLILDRRIKHILFSNTGEVFAMKNNDPVAYIQYAEAAKADKRVTMITNAAEMYYVPTGLDKLIISFNGGDAESYEYTTGLNFHNTVNVIRSQYDKLKRMKSVEIHCLIWQGNAGCEEKFVRLWRDFPGKRRISYKVENQFGRSLAIHGMERHERIECDYLGKLNVAPTGKVIQCAHDFKFETDFGHMLYHSIDDLLKNEKRKKKIEEHKRGIFSGLCTTCNYNTPEDGRVIYVD